MAKRRERLSRADFASVAVVHGKRLSSANLSVVVPGEGVRGYAVVVSKKTARLSVTRHRLKRRVLEALQGQNLPSALIVFPKISAAALAMPELRAEIGALLSKIAPRP